MNNKSFRKKIVAQSKARARRTIIRAKSSAKPWHLTAIQLAFDRIPTNREKIAFLTKSISHIFPVILDMVANGASIPEVERQFHLKDRALVAWLQRRPTLLRLVREARDLRGSTRALGDWVDPPCTED